MNYSEEFEKKTRASKVKLIVALLFFASGLINIGAFYMTMKDTKDNPVAYEDAKIGEYTCIEATMLTDGFAEYTGDDQSAFFAIDDERFYIVSMKDSEYDKYEDLVKYTFGETDEEPEPVRFCGYTETIPDQMRKYGVEYYNEIFETEITATDFTRYFKDYIDTTRKPEDDFSVSCLAGGVIGFVGLIFLLLYLNDIRKTKKTLAKFANEMDKIKMDVASPETIYEKKAKVFLTKEYLINVASGLEIYEYKDILWVYPYEFRQNGYTTQKSIYVITKDTKAHVVANMSTSKKNNITFNELYESILIRVPDALHGYTKENKDKVRELSKKK